MGKKTESRKHGMRTPRPETEEKYREAIELYRTTGLPVREICARTGVPFTAFRSFLHSCHRELMFARYGMEVAPEEAAATRLRKRSDKRERAKSGAKVRGALTGNGSRHEPKAGQTEKYREALRLYRDTALTHRQIAEATGITVTGLRNHLRIWNRRLIVEHRGYECREGEAVDLSRTKQYLKSTAAKYAGAIACLKETGRPTAEVAREFGLHPETFREYVREHEPELAARLGMTRLADGRQVLARSMEKYGEAVRLYETTTEPLRSIADRLGLQYNSVGGFVRRSRPDAIEAHNRLVEREEALRREKEQAESVALALQRENEEKERILSALRQTGGNKRKAAKLLGFSKSTLYNKLNALGLNDTGDT